MFIDSSTMGYQICNHINSRDTHVVSNNPTLLTRLEGIPNLSFYCTGGRFDREALVYVGQEAAKAAGSLSIDMVVLTPDCYSPKHGAGYKNMLQSEFIKSVIPPDAKVIIAMPSTSVANNPAFYTVAPSQISMLITDEALSPEMADQIEKSGVKEEKLTDFDKLYDAAAGEDTSLFVNNVANVRTFEVKTPDVVVKVNPERADLVNTLQIDGKRCLVIEINDHVEVNGITIHQGVSLEDVADEEE